MLTKIIAIASTGFAAVHACTTTTQFPNNPITAPNVADYPTIGQPYSITWDNTGQGPTVDITLYSGCPGNCVAVGPIVTGAANSGSYSWTPPCTFKADTTTEGYGILLVDDTLCMQQWSFHFGLHADTTGACGAVSSAASVVSSPTATTKTTVASSAATSVVSSPTSTTTTNTSAASSGVTSLTTKTTTTAKPSSSTTVPSLIQSTSKATQGIAATASSTSAAGAAPTGLLSPAGGMVALLAAGAAMAL